MSNTTSRPFFFQRALREPVVHFTLIAVIFFLVTEFVSSGRREVIEIDRQEVAWRIQQIEGDTPLSEEERRLAERSYIDEQILAREARILGFDDDQRIRSILSQKMLHILSGGVIQPTEAELRAYYKENELRYVRGPSVTVDEVVVMAGGSGTLPLELGTGLDVERFAENERLRHAVLTEVTIDDLSLVFGPETAAKVFEAEPGVWVGPQQTTLGEHWFRVTDRFDEVIPPAFDAILGQVRYDWIGEKEEALLQERIAELRELYSVKFIGEGPLR
tara:strand:+ start:173 stop:997 length:825 start_codon:yes stop_codon:yes gene_type:complete